MKNKTTIWYCSECNSTDIEQLEWVKVNTRDITGVFGDTSGNEYKCYCVNCEKITDITTKYYGAF